MSKTKIIRPSVDAISMMIQRGRISATGVYDTVNSTPSSMDYIFSHFMEYISYLLSISNVFTLKNVLGLIIFVSGGNK